MPQLEACPRAAGTFLHVSAANGWSGIKNGPLLEKMRQERFDLFITGDRNLQFQQHLPASGIAVIVLRAGSTRLAETLPLMRQVLQRMNSLQPGTIMMIPETIV